MDPGISIDYEKRARLMLCCVYCKSDLNISGREQFSRENRTVFQANIFRQKIFPQLIRDSMTTFRSLWILYFPIPIDQNRRGKILAVIPPQY